MAPIDPRTYLMTFSAYVLKKIASDAACSLGLDRETLRSWMPPQSNTRSLLVDHIDEFCNEFGFSPCINADGKPHLVRNA